MQLVADHAGGTPAQVHRVTHNHAVMGVFDVPGGGTVFNAGVTDWADYVLEPFTPGMQDNPPELAELTSRDEIGTFASRGAIIPLDDCIDARPRCADETTGA